jgi:hypothetical protein
LIADIQNAKKLELSTSEERSMSKQYDILKEYTLDALVVLVNKKIDENWEPVGPAVELVSERGWFIQTIVPKKQTLNKFVAKAGK